jgi:alpha,alpha-trehalase
MTTVPTSQIRTMPGTDVSIDQIDAVIFDMDGVVTDTARVHHQCWKEVFDAYLRRRAEKTGETFRPFETADYLRYVDGKPRYDGAANFLQSREIRLERGDPSDRPGYETVYGLANLKNHAFEETVAREGVHVFGSTVAFIRSLRKHGVLTALISSSRHARGILRSADIEDLFDEVVDGNDAVKHSLPGKPDPAIFLMAARQLDVDPGRSAAVEDALAGVEAARRGGFRLVIGVDRNSQADALRAHGANIVVDDLDDLNVDLISDNS